MATTSSPVAEAVRPTWIWYPGDFEVWLGNEFNNRRTERGAMFPPFWKQDSHWPTVVFRKTVCIDEDEFIVIVAEGKANCSVDGQLQGGSRSLIVPRGTHTLCIKVWNQATPPALFVMGQHIVSDASWEVTYEDKIWIDERGEAHGSGHYVPVGSWNFDKCTEPPSHYRLPSRPMKPVRSWKMGNGRLYDFGREVFGRLKLHHVQQPTQVYYGESRQEALSADHCETLDHISATDLQHSTPEEQPVYTLDSKAFRFVHVLPTEENAKVRVTMDFEYAPFNPERSGSFTCSDDKLNRIWQVSAYTMDLTTREFFVDGIKRDRWTWSGDAIQSYLMNYYLRFDTACVRRTIRQLRGKDPVTAHVNTIMDYTFYWFKSILDYYLYTADAAFVAEIYPRMVTLMDYCLRRTNADGLAEGQPDDWIFVDWVDFPMHKRGTLCFEQILFWKSLQVLARCAALLRDCPQLARYAPGITTETYARDALFYDEMAEKVKSKTHEIFWSADVHALLHAVEDGEKNAMITRFPNMFAIIYDFATGDERRDILQHVLLNSDVPAITTPYMRYYELEALCQMNCHQQVLKEISSYWGGMLDKGATSFWEKYNPAEKGSEHLAMYGRPFGKSLCHAWGASPLYLLGRYFLGVSPTRPGYEEYEVRPVLGGLEWMEGDVPTPYGRIHVKADGRRISVRSDGGQGRLVCGTLSVDIPPHEEITVDINPATI